MAVVVAWRWTGHGRFADWLLPGCCPDAAADSGGMLPGHGSGHPPDTKTLPGQGVGLALSYNAGFRGVALLRGSEIRPVLATGFWWLGVTSVKCTSAPSGTALCQVPYPFRAWHWHQSGKNVSQPLLTPHSSVCNFFELNVVKAPKVIFF